MAVMPALRLGWLNGWLLLLVEWLLQGFLLLVFPKAVVVRLFDRSGWSPKQKAFTVIGKLFSLACLVLIVLTPLKPRSGVFVVGLVVYAVGVAGLVMAMLNFRDTLPDQPVTKGLYRVSRHPQAVAIAVFIGGICLAVGSWAALLMLVLSKVFQHFGILAEEEVCLSRYGESYRAYMVDVPRYFLFF